MRKSEKPASSFLEELETKASGQKSIDGEIEAASFKESAWATNNVKSVDSIIKEWASETAGVFPVTNKKNTLFNKQKLRNSNDDYESSRQVIRFHIHNKISDNNPEPANLREMIDLVLKCLTAAKQFDYCVSPPEGLDNLGLLCSKKELLIWIISYLNTVQKDRLDLLKNGKWLAISEQGKQLVLNFPLNVPSNISNSTFKDQENQNLTPDNRLTQSDDNSFLRFEFTHLGQR